MIFKPEKAILVGVELSGAKPIPLKESLEELGRLAATAGAQVVGQITQKREKPDLKYFIGLGKLEELKTEIASLNATLVIFDNELSASQDRNLEEALNIQVIDRTELILDIFAKHAKSREGMIQVKLAKLEYQLPRLAGMWEHLNRQRGGIGLREAGEKQIELDRRMIRKKISNLKNEIEKISRERRLRREKRRKAKIPVAALVGYTNSGKSTLLNALTKAQVLTEDQLFSTLDPTIRRLYFSDGRAVLLTDTVGFVQKLPHQLVAAFSATLEEATEADLLLHIVDISHPHFENQIKAVLSVLEELKCAEKTILTVFNKIDALKEKIAAEILEKYKPAIAISALYHRGLEDLLRNLATSLFPLP